jgi:hypothetical protein
MISRCLNHAELSPGRAASGRRGRLGRGPLARGAWGGGGHLVSTGRAASRVAGSATVKRANVRGGFGADQPKRPLTNY